MKTKVFLIFSILFIFLISSSFADEKEKMNKKMIINSDNSTLYFDKNITEFTGNVKVIIGKTTITADKLTGYTKDSKKLNSKNSKDSFEKIIATGNVVIKFKEMTAKSEKAIFLSNGNMLIMEGGRPTITDGKDRIESDKIIYDMQSEVLKFEKNSDEQVKATFTNTDEKK